MKFVTSRGEAFVTAVIVTNWLIAVPTLVMNCLDPLITHSSPSWRAFVRRPPASDPPPGSVRPKPASFSPRARGGS